MLRQDATAYPVRLGMNEARTAIKRSHGGYLVVCAETRSATKFFATHSLRSSTVRDVIKYIGVHVIIIERSRIFLKGYKYFIT
jgi:hypothetical protein